MNHQLPAVVTKKIIGYIESLLLIYYRSMADSSTFAIENRKTQLLVFIDIVYTDALHAVALWEQQ